MKKNVTKFIAVNAAVAAIYVVLTMPFGVLAANQYIQFRPAEALTVLPALFPYTVVGLTVGCAISNIVSAFGIFDILLGSLTTLLAGALTAKVFRRFWSAPIPPVILNAAFLPLIWMLSPNAEAGLTAYLLSAGGLLVSQSAVIFGLGIPLYFVAKKHLTPLLSLTDLPS